MDIHYSSVCQKVIFNVRQLLKTCSVFLRSIYHNFYSQLGKCIANSFFNSEVIFALCSHRYLNVCLLFIDGNGLIRLDLTMQIKYILLLSVKEKMQYLGDCLWVYKNMAVNSILFYVFNVSCIPQHWSSCQQSKGLLSSTFFLPVFLENFQGDSC